VAVDLNDGARNVDDPVLDDTGGRVQLSLTPPIQGARGDRHFHDEVCRARMRRRRRRLADQGKIRLGHGILGHLKRQLDAQVALSGAREVVRQTLHERCVPWTVGTRLDWEPIEQLETLIVERAGLDDPSVAARVQPMHRGEEIDAGHPSDGIRAVNGHLMGCAGAP
jgi:hypothetical protein